MNTSIDSNRPARRDEIQIRSGRYFDFVEPDTNQFSIYDIAASISKLCRFTGHCNEFYSVAQHSVMASYIVPPEFAYDALMHDAAEAFTGDVSKPLKNLLPDFKIIEKRVERVVFARFGVRNPLPDYVKYADLVMLATERRDLMPEDDEDWESTDGIPELPEIIVPVNDKQAYTMFMNRYYELRGLPA
ncbi:MAG TPA: metal-dependent phosphohydrolase [Noviherbaspirillum sp.]|nr:metal-dependent phosphohydrolase [Noviherbaspirillum sp.]